MAAAQAQQRQGPTQPTMTRAQHNRVARPTPDEVALLKRHYDGHGKQTIRLAMHFNVSRSTVCRWAKRYGLTHPKHTAKPWSAREIDVLDAAIGKTKVTELSGRLGRTVAAVHQKACRVGLTKCSHDYTAASLAEAVGVSPHTVAAWVARGWLPGARRHSDRTPGQGDYWRFTDRDVAGLLARHPGEVFPRGTTAEQWIWAASVMAHGQGGK